MNAETMKACTRCKRELPMVEYRPNGGRMGITKTCTRCRAKNLRWVDRNREASRRMSREWYEKNKEHRTAYEARYYQEVAKPRRAARLAADPEGFRKRDREYRRARREAAREVSESNG